VAEGDLDTTRRPAPDLLMLLVGIGDRGGGYRAATGG
jgi:hypothetical protein